MHRVAGDREAGAGDVLLAQVGQRLLELPAPLRVAARDLLPRRAGLPDAQEPDPVEAHLRQAVQFGVRNVVQRGRPAQRPGQLRQPDAGVDLVERRIARVAMVVFVSRDRRFVVLDCSSPREALHGAPIASWSAVSPVTAVGSTADHQSLRRIAVDDSKTPTPALVGEHVPAGDVETHQPLRCRVPSARAARARSGTTPDVRAGPAR